MKDLIKKIITKGYSLTDYVPVGIDQVREKAFLKLGESLPVEVTDQQFTLAYNPVVIGIVMSQHLYETARNVQRGIKLYFTDGITGETISAVDLKYYKIPDVWKVDHSILVLFHAREAYNYQLNWFRRNAILWLRYWKNKKAKRYFGTLPFVLHKQYTAQFSFPRKVALATVKDGDFYSLFPIDLHGVMHDQNIYIWGIRHSNKAVPHLRNSRRMVIAEVPYTSYEAIYSLGNFKSGKKDDNSGAAKIISHTWQYVLPDFVLGYKEIELEHHENIGSQCLFLGSIVHEEVLRPGSALHHVHLLRFLQLQNPDQHTYSTNYR